MSSPDSYQDSPSANDLAEAPRKKGARGGKRSVTHLSKAQLARKRANDREAQRNIRQRTKEHIESLERRVRELEGNDPRSLSMERVMKRNEELENEIEKLKAQLNNSHTTSPTTPNCPDMSHELLFPKREPSEWLLDPGCPWPGPGANMPELNPSPPYSSAEMYSGSAMAPAMGYVDDEASQQLYTPMATPIWQDPAMPGQSSQSLTKPTTAWAPFHPSFSQPSRFAEILTSRFDAMVSTPPEFPKPTNRQSQPSMHGKYVQN
ncbi:hypothetical protein B7494_g7355 [Chlorociboria aeruginascens]|nr:hypothetical protein B7494_g7355 [Chlorociboria aeruginascens]